MPPRNACRLYRLEVMNLDIDQHPVMITKDRNVIEHMADIIATAFSPSPFEFGVFEAANILKLNGRWLFQLTTERRQSGIERVISQGKVPLRSVA